MLLRFAIRDAAIALAATAVWLLAARHSGGAGALADLTGVVAGLLVGVTAAVSHEWGHLLAGAAAGGRMRINADLRSQFLFSFDADASTLRQFVVMSLGGFVVTGLFVWLVYALLPDGLLATRVARGAVLFLASLGFVIELPLLLVALARGRVPGVAAVKVRRLPEDGPARAAA
ncbi:MAG: hypothetical protein DCC71_16200 [Proteobacteria bacterium]|nr:MAG: hypothetical protein DCC71_16200 [Pseudomonadota bacterium]